MQLRIYFSTVIPMIIGIPMGSDPAPFFSIYSYIFMKKRINKLKKNDLIKARTLCNIFKLNE